MRNDYKNHAAVWDWDGYDMTQEYLYWCSYAEKYGDKVLIPMCALGSVGAFMAKRGYSVTGFDLTEEMIVEGKKRYGDVAGLNLVVGNICSLDLPNRDYDFVFSKDQDLHLLPSLTEFRQALYCLSHHIRVGGGLVLELTLPGKESNRFSKQVFHPRVPHYTDKRVWKESECWYDAQMKQNHIDQTVFIEQNGIITSFPYSICLQYYDRDTVLEILNECRFYVVGEYSSRERQPFDPNESFWLIEAIKQ